LGKEARDMNYINELINNTRDNAAFDAVVATLRADKAIRRQEMRAIARAYLGYEIAKAKGRTDALRAIIERQMIEARQMARGRTIDRWAGKAW
jgi:hypothetical protein